jgi:predicted GIY-YIG superfamily endonuclease
MLTEFFLMPYYVYILKCADSSYYTGGTDDLSKRIWQHQEGVTRSAYTFSRRPVELVWSEEVSTYHEAITHEHQIKGWTRVKKEALIRGDFTGIHNIVKAERKRQETNKKNKKKTKK